MRYRVECDVAVDEVSSAGEAWQLMIDYMGMVFPHGRRAFVMLVGPEAGEPAIRFDVDADTGRAAVTWLADGAVGTEPGVPPCHAPLVVCESSDSDPVLVPAERAVVTPGGALQTLAAYVSSGERPATLDWTA